MSITVKEAFTSPELTVGGNGPSGARRYIVKGASSETEALEEVKATAPEYYEDLVRESRTVRPLGYQDGSYVYEVEVRYSVEDDSKANDVEETASSKKQNTVLTTNESSFSFDTSGGTEHITIARMHIADYPEGAAGSQGVLGFDGESVNGIEIQVPAYNFSETHIIPASTVTSAYKETVADTTKCVNTGTFRGFAPGEVLFLGASGTRRGVDEDDDWEITFSFSRKKNLDNPVIGEVSVFMEVHGWYHVEVRYKDAEDSNNIIQVPASVHIDQVYETADFSVLEIGTDAI